MTRELQETHAAMLRCLNRHGNQRTGSNPVNACNFFPIYFFSSRTRMPIGICCDFVKSQKACDRSGAHPDSATYLTRMLPGLRGSTPSELAAITTAGEQVYSPLHYMRHTKYTFLHSFGPSLLSCRAFRYGWGVPRGPK
jgi:hypothetical protein